MKTQIPKGFTIVELLIVIVVIGILAAITLVAFGGVRDRANDSTVQSNLSAIGKQAAAYYAVNNFYPASAAQVTAAYPDISFSISQSAYSTGSNNFIYCYGGGTSYALVARSASGKNYYVGTATNHSAKEFPASFPGSQVDVCPAAGASNAGNWGYNGSTWQSWVR